MNANQIALPITEEMVRKVGRTSPDIVYLRFARITPVGILNDAQGNPSMAVVTGYTAEGGRQEMALTKATVAQFMPEIVRGAFFPSGDASPRGVLDEGPTEGAKDAPIPSLQNFNLMAAVRPRANSVKTPSGAELPLCEAIHAFADYNRRQANDPAGAGNMQQVSRIINPSEPAEIRCRILPGNGAVIVYYFPATVQTDTVLDLIKSLDLVTGFRPHGPMAEEGKLKGFSVRRKLSDIDWAIVSQTGGVSMTPPVPVGTGSSVADRDLSKLPD